MLRKNTISTILAIVLVSLTTLPLPSTSFNLLQFPKQPRNIAASLPLVSSPTSLQASPINSSEGSSNKPNAKVDRRKKPQFRRKRNYQPPPAPPPPPDYFSKKPLSDFSTSKKWSAICKAAGITYPTKIQAIAWPSLLGDGTAPCVIGEQTGGGKTLAYLVPPLLNIEGKVEDNGVAKPSILVLAPTSELVNQVASVSKSLTGKGAGFWRTSVVSASGKDEKDGTVREQARELSKKGADVLVGTPGRVSQLLNAKPFCLSLENLKTIVLDEVDVLISDDTFGEQLNRIGVKVGEDARFVFVSATLPTTVIDLIEKEFGGRKVTKFLGPGLHRAPAAVKEYLVDVSVGDNRDPKMGFDKKADALMEALRRQKCERTLVFCNTVETCRKVENHLKRKDRKGDIYEVGAYHGAMNGASRTAALKKFSKKSHQTDQVLICTDRAARGVDFEGEKVDHVVVFDFPKDPAEYVRRVGRTGRAGRDGIVSVFAYGWQLPIARGVIGEKDGSKSTVDVFIDDDDDDDFKASKSGGGRKRINYIDEGKLWGDKE
ncbi:hypothetical protein TrVE_jg11390 [Triparma verrucosa]|uniref:RNA helicase n=1 Tax=Triparma verrucosa TaxID=1606542 RepID=A0A9W7B3K8_9STRA|nr:hypothetical protein TrVE_jg11390 [Triparma verrucosa]